MSNTLGTPVKGQTNTPNDKLNARQWVQVREVSGGTVGLSALADRGTYEGIGIRGPAEGAPGLSPKG